MRSRSTLRYALALVFFVEACANGRSTPLGPTSEPPSSMPQTVVLAGAGDIADCSAAAEGGVHARETGRLLDAVGSDAVFTAGDNAYPNGSTDDFNSCYDPAWGRFKSKTFPVPGNHDYGQPGALPYFQYFGDRAGAGGFRQGYYSYNLGNWHIIALNSPLHATGGFDQLMWLKDDLDSARARCTLAYWHHPVFTSGPSNGQPESRVMREVWQVLFAAGVDLIVNGHDHLYERFAPQDPDGRPNGNIGITEIIVGTGGAPLYDFTGTTLNSAARLRTHGILKLTLRNTSYDSVFMQVNGAAFDAFTATCH